MPAKKKSEEDKKPKKTVKKKTTTTKSKTAKAKTPAKSSTVTKKPSTPKKTETMNATSRSYLSTTSALAARAARPQRPSTSIPVSTGAGVLAAARAAGRPGTSGVKPTMQSALTDLSRKEIKVKPSSIEPVRFSVKKNLDGGHESGSIRKILLYIVVVVAVGLGLIFVIENFIQNGTEVESPDITKITASEQSNFDHITLSTTVQKDSSAVLITPNEDYGDENSSLGSNLNAGKSQKVTDFSHEVFESFTRTTWTLTGVEKGMPQTTVEYDSGTKKLNLLFSGVTAEEELLQQVTISKSNVRSILGSEKAPDVNFELTLITDSKFVVLIDGDSVVLDIKTDEQLKVPTSIEDEPEVVTDPVVEPEPEIPEVEDDPIDSGPPEGNNFNNIKSQLKQYITSDVTGKSLISETYFYRDDVSAFLFSWGIRGEGTSKAPNASAEYIEVDGKDYIEVKISNLSYDQLHSTGKSKANIAISTSGTPLSNVFTHSFKNGVATFRARVSKKVDFKLMSTLDYEGYHLLTLKVFDK